MKISTLLLLTILAVTLPATTQTGDMPRTSAGKLSRQSGLACHVYTGTQKYFVSILNAIAQGLDQQAVDAIDDAASEYGNSCLQTYRDEFGNTFLHHAVKTKSRGIIERLIAAGLSATIQNNEGISAIIQAMDTQEREIVTMLLPTIPAAERDPLIHYAARHSTGAIMTRLIAGGARLFRDEHNESALYNAVTAGNESATIVLLAQQKFQWDKIKSQVPQLLYHAMRHRRLSLFMILIDAIPLRERASLFAREIYTSNREEIGVLLEMAATLPESYEFVSMLLANGAPPMTRNADNRTPLMCAILHGAPLLIVNSLWPMRLNQTYAREIFQCVHAARRQDIINFYGLPIDLEDSTAEECTSSDNSQIEDYSEDDTAVDTQASSKTVSPEAADEATNTQSEEEDDEEEDVIAAAFRRWSATGTRAAVAGAIALAGHELRRTDSRRR